MVAGKASDWLPAGWTEHVQVKNDRKIKCYIDPLTGRRFYSKPQVSEYLRTVKHNNSTPQRKKMGIASITNPNIDKLIGGKTALKLERSQYRTRSSSKQIQMGFNEESVERKLLLHNTGEITGGKTTLKQDGAPNVRTPKRTSCASKRKQTGFSKQSLEKVVSERVTPDELPPGWIKDILQYYTDPVSGYVFFSQKDALRYLETGDFSSCTIKPKKRNELEFLSEESSGTPDMGELSGGKISLKQKGSRNVKTPKLRSRVSKHKQMGFSKQPIEKVMIERVTPERLPPGWIKEIKIQKKANGTRKDPYYTDPVSGYVFYSQNDALRYLETGDFSSCITKPRKRSELGFLNEETSLSPNMIELTGGKTSLKQEGPKKVKTPDPKSCTSKRKQMGFNKQSVDKVVIERVTPDGLPPGWIKEIKIQKKANGTRKDPYYTDPVSGHVFFSQKDALRYLENGDFDKCSIKPKKRDELEFLNEVASPNMGELPGGKTSPKLDTSRNVKTRKRTNCTSEKKQKGFTKQSVEKPNMGELTESKTSLKLEGPRNVKTPKHRISASKEKERGFAKQSEEKVVIERVTPAGLPPGWIQEIKIQMKENGIRRDPYYTDPTSGYVFRSKKDALRYLETGDFSRCATKPKKSHGLGFLNEDNPFVADGPRKRQRRSVPADAIITTTPPMAEILEGEHSLANVIEECAGTMESYDPSNSQLLSTKDSNKRKRGKRVRAENGTVSTPSTRMLREKSLEQNGKEKKSNRKTQNAGGRSSKRLAGLICEMVANLGLSDEAADRKSVETDAKPSLGALVDNVAYIIPQQFETLSQTEIADHALRGTETLLETETGGHALWGTETPPNVEKPLEDDTVLEDEPVRQETEKKDEENPGPEVGLFGDSWSDPCIEFAFKTLSGVIPVDDDNLPNQADTFQQQADTSHAPPPGCLALLDFSAPNPFQNDNLSDTEAPGKSVSDSAPELPTNPTFVPPGNANLPSCSDDAPQDQPNLEGKEED